MEIFQCHELFFYRNRNRCLRYSGEVYTLRINSKVSSVTIPEASKNHGRILILTAFQGMGNRPFNFLSGDTLYDISTGNDITSISSGNRSMIQSIGTRWVVLFK